MSQPNQPKTSDTKQPSVEARCPHCGYCEHCGRSNFRPYPWPWYPYYVQPPYVQPYYPYYGSTITTVSISPSTSYTATGNVGTSYKF